MCLVFLLIDIRKTTRHLEIETLKTQRFVATASNRRSRSQIENEAASSQKLATNENWHAEKIALEHMGNVNLRVFSKVLYNMQVNLQDVENMYIAMSINHFIDVIFDFDCGLAKSE
ncbi:hypothetical protein CLU79DRAFT_806799 [Phycomyces nitens]|nr:hypothetical protein CLU79DRAFT_806799 [Phycomyces nitens]